MKSTSNSRAPKPMIRVTLNIDPDDDKVIGMLVRQDVNTLWLVCRPMRGFPEQHVRQKGLEISLGKATK